MSFTKKVLFNRIFMSLNPEQVKTLKHIFDEQTEQSDGMLTEEGLKKLLLDFDIDESFAPPMLRIISSSSKDGRVEFESFLKFFEILMSQNIKSFFESLFHAIDVNGDGKLLADDLVEFGKLIGDTISKDEAEQIIFQCDLDGSGSIEFDDFWNWFSEKH